MKSTRATEPPSAIHWPNTLKPFLAKMRLAGYTVIEPSPTHGLILAIIDVPRALLTQISIHHNDHFWTIDPSAFNANLHVLPTDTLMRFDFIKKRIIQP